MLSQASSTAPLTAPGESSSGPSFGTTQSQASSSSPVLTEGLKMRADDSALQSGRSEVEASANPFPFHSINVCESLWKVGFQSGAYSDVDIHVRTRCYKLHKLILSRSPYLAHLMEVTPAHHSVWVRIDDENVTDEAIAIVLGHLYAAYSYSMVTTANARDVLAAAILFGLPDIAAYAFDLARQSINVDNIVGWVDWCENQGQGPHVVGNGAPVQFGFPNGDFAGSDGSRSSSPGVFAGGAGGAAAAQGPRWDTTDPGPQADYAARLRFFVYQYLVSGLSRDLAASSDSQSYSASSDPRFLQILSCLPFELFRSLIENSAVPLGSDQERFAFAKKAIAARKKRTAAAAAIVEGVGGQSQGASAVMAENVVLQFTGGSGSNVHITRKPRTSKPLWKVVKS